MLDFPRSATVRAQGRVKLRPMTVEQFKNDSMNDGELDEDDTQPGRSLQF